MNEEPYNEIHYLEIETLSPVHIGSGGTSVRDLDFIPFERGKGQAVRAIAVIDYERVFQSIGPSAVPEWTQAISSGRPTFDVVKRYQAAIKPDQISLRVLHQDFPGDGPPEFREMVLNGAGQPYLPGSSIKGAIRTALLAQGLLAQGKKKFALGQHRIKEIVTTYFGTDMNSEVMRFVTPGDAHFTTSACYKLEILNKYSNGWGFKKDGIRYVEAIPPGQRSCLRIVLPKVLKEELAKDKRNQGGVRHEVKHERVPTLQSLLRDCHAQSMRLIREELAFWSGQGQPDISNDYCDGLRALLDLAEGFDPSKETLLRLGFGVGWKGVTGGWQAGYMHKADYEELESSLACAPMLPFPKTRKLVGGEHPMGFVRLRVVPHDLRQRPVAVVVTAPEALQPSGPRYHSGPLRVNAEVEASYEPKPGDADSSKRFRLYLQAPGMEQEVLLRYPAALPPGQRALVRIKSIGKAGKVEAIEIRRLR